MLNKWTKGIWIRKHCSAICGSERDSALAAGAVLWINLAAVCDLACAFLERASFAREA